MTADDWGKEIEAMFESERNARQSAQAEVEKLKGVIDRSGLEKDRAVLAEHEACATLCELNASICSDRYEITRDALIHCAKVIRARGKPS